MKSFVAHPESKVTSPAAEPAAPAPAHSIYNRLHGAGISTALESLDLAFIGRLLSRGAR